MSLWVVTAHLVGIGKRNNMEYYRRFRSNPYTKVLEWTDGHKLVEDTTSPVVVEPADLSFGDYSGKSYTRWDLRFANMVGSDFSNSSFRKADLRCACLDGAGLRNVDFEYAWLDAASLRGADLTGANLFRTSLIHADLTGANLEGVKRMNKAIILFTDGLLLDEETTCQT